MYEKQLNIDKEEKAIAFTDLENDRHYQHAIATKEKGTVYIGSFKNTPLGRWKNEIKEKGRHAQYYGQIFCPESTGDPWSYDSNLAFMAGVISSRRPVMLLIDINSYTDLRRIEGATPSEILWLADSGYTFEQDPSNSAHTIAKPPPTCIANSLLKYKDDNERSIHPERIVNRINAIARRLYFKTMDHPKLEEERQKLESSLNRKTYIPPAKKKQMQNDLEMINQVLQEISVTSQASSIQAPSNPEPKTTTASLSVTFAKGNTEDAMSDLNLAASTQTQEPPSPKQPPSFKSTQPQTSGSDETTESEEGLTRHLRSGKK